MRQEIVEAGDLWRADWNGLCRLARFVGLDVADGPEGHRRGLIVSLVMHKITALRSKDWDGKRWHNG